MSQFMTAEEIRAIASMLEGWGSPKDFKMPTLEDIESDLGLGEPPWTGLLVPGKTSAGPAREPEINEVA